MPATVSGSKTVTKDRSPVLTAAKLTSLFATAPENFTVGQVTLLGNYLASIQGGENPDTVVGSLFS